jgi:hypothetical protein
MITHTDRLQYHPETLTNTPYYREKCTLQKVYFLVILVVRVRKYVGDHPEDAQMHKTNLNVAHFP